MTPPPRLALATPGDGPEPSMAALSWLAGLSQTPRRVQHFRSRACPTGTNAVNQASGLPSRHLDAWLMPVPVMQRLFARGARQADFSIVEGTLDPVENTGGSYCERPGSLKPVALALNLPMVGVLPCPSAGSFHLPHVPAEIDAIFLDGLDDPEEFDSLRRFVRWTTGRPVIGALETLPEIRAAVRESPRDRWVPEELLGRLAQSFLRFIDLPMLDALAASRPFEAPGPETEPSRAARFRVAYAMDDAFGAYFPDTLEALESLGADLVEFSPVHDERLPDRADLVMIGCGYPDHQAEALAENLSLKSSLLSYVCSGKRVYAEGGGSAYLGRWMYIDGRRVEGAGILPFDAELIPEPEPPRPVERRLERDCWMGPKDTVVRGYLSGRWRLLPGAEPMTCPRSYGRLVTEEDLHYHHHAVGGLIHLHLGALDQVRTAFAGPHRASLTLPTPRH